MGLCEANATAGQSRHIGRQGIGVSSIAFDVVIQVIADDQDDIGAIGSAGVATDKQQNKW